LSSYIETKLIFHFYDHIPNAMVQTI